jgi:hypothetical protein
MADGLPVVKYEDVLKKPFRLAEICQGVKKQLQIASYAVGKRLTIHKNRLIINLGRI